MAFDKRKALQNALTQMQQGKWDKAIAEYLAILKADPHDLTVCNNLGDLYARVGKASEAIEQYLKLGELYRADGLSVKAIAVYKKIIKLDPNRTEALVACADLYEEQGLMGEAKIQLATVAEHYSKAGNTQKVIEIYQRLAALDQTNHVLLTKFAELLHREGRREEAAAQYGLAAQAAEEAGHAAESKRLLAKARALSPKSAEVNLAQAEQLLREGQYGDAADVLLKATAIDRKNAQAWCLLGEAYIGLGQAREASTALEESVSLGMPEDEVQRPLAKALVLEGRTAEGITLCQKLTENALARNNPEEAITACQEIVALAPNLAPIHAHLVGLLQDLGRDEEARAAIRALAAAHEACGEAKEAIQIYHQLLESDPSDAQAKARLEVLEGSAAPTVQGEKPSVAGPEGSPAEAEPFVLEEVAPAEPVPTKAAPAEPVPTKLSPVEFVPAEAAPAEPVPTVSAPASLVPEEPLALELSSDDALILGDVAEFGLGEGLEPEARPAQVFELDESGELAGIRYPTQETQGVAAEGLVGLKGPAIELPGEGSGQDDLEVEAPGEGEEEEASGEVAELLAEAEVYLKYGLTEKARERLLEVARLAPENLTAHRQLKALYLERPQVEEACGEILAIARILHSRGQLEAAQRELQEGLKLVPGDPAAQRMLARISGTSRPVKAIPAVETAPLHPPESLAPSIPQRPVAPGGEVARDVQVGPPVVEEAGVAEAVPSEAPPSEMAPTLEPTDHGGERISLEGELPPELRSFLEEPGEEPALVIEGAEAGLDQAMADDLAEGEFYLSQEMVAEAQTVHQRMRARDAEHPAVARLGEQINTSIAVKVPGPRTAESKGAASIAGPREATGPGPQEVSPPDVPDFLPETPLEAVLPAEARATGAPVSATPAGPPRGAARPIQEPVAQPPAAAGTSPTQTSAFDMITPRFSVIQGGGEAGADGFVNLGAELEEELAAEDRTPSAGTAAPLTEDLLREFQKGVREHLDEKDFETHYNLGIAYKEMELYDEAIQEFQLAARDPGRALACADLLGLCYLAKGDPVAAIRELQAGLGIRGRPRESYSGLRYDLGMAYETNGELERALESFEALLADDERFRDVSARVRDLRERLHPPQVTSLPASPVPTGEPAKRAKGKKKISFI